MSLLLKQLNRLIWVSPICYNKGASSQQKDLAAQQAAFYKTLTADYGIQFANQSAILSSLKTAFDPILQAGIGQYGFTPAEDAAIRTSASDAIAENFASAQTALNENIASRGGGNVFLPTGATAQLEAGLLGSEATQQATTSNQITQAGYSLGRQNFLTAASVLGGTASQYGPTGYISGANTAGNNAFDSSTTIFKENQSAAKVVGGILGGAAGSFIGQPELGAQLGAGLGGAFGG